MIYIDINRSVPLKEGSYDCLVDIDGFGNLQIALGEHFNGRDWSYNQFIKYWKASKEDYKIISDKQDQEFDK